MKNFKLLALLSIILITSFISGCGNNTKLNNQNSNTENTSTQNNEAINYNDSIINIASKCHESAEITRDSYDNNDEILQIETNAKNTLSECQNSINQISDLGDLQGDSSLKDGIISLLNLYITYFTKFNEMLTYLENEDLPKEDITSYEAIVKDIKELDNEIESANNDFINTQELFANNHGFELESSE